MPVLNAGVGLLLAAIVLGIMLLGRIWLWVARHTPSGQLGRLSFAFFVFLLALLAVAIFLVTR